MPGLNFGFYWDDESVSNELDLILTRKGSLQTAVISCKTSVIKREHIYEVLYLAQRFSLNSKAAIIYTQNRFATEDAPNESVKHDPLAGRRAAAHQGDWR